MQTVQDDDGDASRWCIVTAIAALGVKTSLVALAKLVGRAVGLMVAETIFIAIFVLVVVRGAQRRHTDDCEGGVPLKVFATGKHSRDSRRGRGWRL
jgi:hypothetical protein